MIVFYVGYNEEISSKMENRRFWRKEEIQNGLWTRNGGISFEIEWVGRKNDQFGTFGRTWNKNS